jgi:hypothetical protein
MPRLVADGVSQIKGAEVDIRRADKVDCKDLQKYEGIVMGSPTHYGLGPRRSKPCSMSRRRFTVNLMAK